MITIICDRWSSRIKLGAVKQQQRQQSWMAGLVWRLNPRMSWSSAGEAPSTQMARVCVCHAGNKLQAGRSTTERRVSLSAVRPTAPFPPSLSLSHQTWWNFKELLFVYLFVCSQSGDCPEEYVEKNLWLSSFRKISKPNLAIRTKYEIPIFFLSKIWL